MRRPVSATAFYISETDSEGNSLGTLIATWDDSTTTPKGRIYIQNTTQRTNFAVLDIISTVTDNGTWNTLRRHFRRERWNAYRWRTGVSLFIPYGNGGRADRPAGSTGPTGAAGTTGATGPTGPTGLAGPTTAPVWTFDSATAVDPTSNKFRAEQCVHCIGDRALHQRARPKRQRYVGMGQYVG